MLKGLFFPPRFTGSFPPSTDLESLDVLSSQVLSSPLPLGHVMLAARGSSFCISELFFLGNQVLDVLLGRYRSGLRTLNVLRHFLNLALRLLCSYSGCSTSHSISKQTTWVKHFRCLYLNFRFGFSRQEVPILVFVSTY